jgi:hypothetical protein
MSTVIEAAVRILRDRVHQRLEFAARRAALLVSDSADGDLTVG